MGKPHRNTKIMPSANASFDKRRAAIAHSRRELEKLLSKPPTTKDKSHGKVAFIGAAEITLHTNDSTIEPLHQAGFGGKHE